MMRCCCGVSGNSGERRSLSLRNLSFRHQSPRPDSVDSKKTMRARKSKSSGDVREVKDEVKAAAASSGSSSSPTSPVSSTPPSTPASPNSPTSLMVTVQDPVSRRTKLWKSFRVRTGLFSKRRNRSGDEKESAPAEEENNTDAAATAATTTGQRTPIFRPRTRRPKSRPRSYVSRSSSEEVTVSSSGIRRWRSDIVRQVSVCEDATDMEEEARGKGREKDGILVAANSTSLNHATCVQSDFGENTAMMVERAVDCGEKSTGAARGDVGNIGNNNTATEKDEVDSGIALGDGGNATTPSSLVSETALRQRQTALMEHPFFLLEIRLQEGVDLVIRDSCGTSDPYVKFKIAGKQVYRSRTIFKNLNPKWEENFTIPIEDVSKPLYLKVFDYDRGLSDDPMGNAFIDISQLELGKTTNLKLDLSERGKTEYMGYLLLSCTLQPKTQEDKDQFMRRTVRVSGDSGGGTSSKKMKLQMWTAVVTIVLVDGKDLMAMDDNGLSDPYVKFRLGAEKYRSKIKPKTLTPRWLEQFDLRLFNEQSSQLEIIVYDYDVTKDDFMGRATVDVSSLEAEVTHRLQVALEDGAGTLTLLVTVSGLWGSDAVSDLSNYTPDPRQQEKLLKHYGPFKLAHMSDVGHLQVKVFKASGLKAADLGGLSDPFCVLELVNARRQTHTEYKTLNPEWNKIYEFPVLDIHSVLEVTVFDEDRDKKVEFLGKVAIPLLKITSGERKWYALKDRKLAIRSKGAILMEMSVVFNHVKAAVRTVNPAEVKLMQVEPKFKIHIMKRNIDRVSQLISIFVEGGKFLQSCFNWESRARSLSAFVIFLVLVWNFEPYMLPITLLLIFVKNLLIAQIVGALRREPVEDECVLDDDDDDDEDKEKNTKAKMNEKEEKKSFKEKLQSIQEVCLQVQQGMDMVASLGERVKNTFNWTVPWLTTLAVVALSVGVFVLYYIPVRWLILAWGINKFTKKLRKPNAISNNELLDFLSRVPSDSELAQYREFRPELSPAPKKKRS